MELTPEQIQEQADKYFASLKRSEHFPVSESIPNSWIAGAQWMQEREKWISVDVAYPDHYNPVLCIFSMPNYTEYSVGRKYKRPDGSYCIVDLNEESSITITHWTVLPSPPKD